MPSQLCLLKGSEIPTRTKIESYGNTKRHCRILVDLSKYIYAEGNVAQIRIVGSISQFWNSSEEIQSRVDELKSQGITHAKVYIKTYGGDVMEANEMANILIEAFETGSVELGAYCASAGTRIAVDLLLKWGACSAPKNLQYMIHRPTSRLSGNWNEIENEVKVLKSIENDYAKAYAEVSTLTEDEIRELWANGDYWMDANEAKAKGFITEIKNQEDKVDAKEHKALKEAGFKIAAFGTPGTPPKQNSNSNSNSKIDMELKAMAMACGLEASANESEVMAKINQYKSDSIELKALKETNATKAKTQKIDEIKSMTAEAIKGKKIKAEFAGKLEATATKMIENGLEGVDHVKSTLEAIAPAASPGEVKTPEMNADGSAKKWGDYSPKELNALAESDLEAFKAIYKEEHGEEFQMRVDD